MVCSFRQIAVNSPIYRYPFVTSDKKSHTLCIGSTFKSINSQNFMIFKFKLYFYAFQTSIKPQ